MKNRPIYMMKKHYLARQSYMVFSRNGFFH